MRIVTVTRALWAAVFPAPYSSSGQRMQKTIVHETLNRDPDESLLFPTGNIHFFHGNHGRRRSSTHQVHDLIARAYQFGRCRGSARQVHLITLDCKVTRGITAYNFFLDHVSIFTEGFHLLRSHSARLEINHTQRSDCNRFRKYSSLLAVNAKARYM